jgi:hypothetical protein
VAAASAADGGLLVVQHLLLGINAHVNFDSRVTALAGLVRRPAAPMRWLVPVARLFETRDAPTVTRRLLGPLAA